MYQDVTRREIKPMNPVIIIIIIMIMIIIMTILIAGGWVFGFHVTGRN